MAFWAALAGKSIDKELIMIKGFSKKAFKEWVMSQSDRKIAGVCGHTGKCVVAKFIIHLGAKHTEVYEDKIYINSGIDNKIYESPVWVLDVIRDFDLMNKPGKRVTFGSFKKEMGWV
jgi:hypothetical protein